jgi:DNA transposition AAA+ family ATPase
MKDKFVQTKNVKRFISAVERINHKLRGVERMALVYGDPGYGKTETAIQYAISNGAVMIKTPKLTTARWILEEIVEQLGASPAGRTRDLFNQAVDLLSDRKCTVIVDEVDRFAGDSTSLIARWCLSAWRVQTRNLFVIRTYMIVLSRLLSSRSSNARTRSI